LLGACGSPGTPDGSAALADGGVPDGIAYEQCTTYCLRPADCALTYPSDDLCPSGFLCAARFSCSADAAARD